MGRPQRQQPQERSLDQTLRDLNIPKNASPVEVAADAAEESSEEHDDDEGGDVDEQDEEQLSQQQSGVAMTDDLDDDDEGSGGGEDVQIPSVMKPPKLDPAVIPNPVESRRRGGRGKAPQAAKTVAMSKSIMEKVPGAEKVMVEKRVEGKKWFVAEYQRDDLESFPNFESFLTRYVKPRHGAGEYDLTGIDGRNNKHNLGQIRLLEDGTVRSTDAEALKLVERVLLETREREEKWMKERMSGQQDPLALLAGVMNLKKQLDGEAGNSMGGMADVFKTVMESSKESGNTTLTMMMAMMQQQSQMMMALLTKPKEPDPVMTLLMTKLVEGSLGGGGGGGMAMPPPPPPPQQESLASVMTAMAAFMSSMQPGGGGEDEFKEFLKARELSRASETLGMKDIIQLIMEAKNGNGQSNGFKDTIDNLAAVMNIAQNINRANEPGASAGLWDALASLFSNRDFAGSIAQAVRMKADARAGTVEQRLQAEAQRLAMERRLLEQEKQRLLSAGGTIPQGVTPPQQVAQPVQQTAPHVQNTVPHVQQTAPNGQPRRPAVVTQEQAQQAAQREIQRTGKIPELPPQTFEHINNILTAKDDGDRVAKVVVLLMYFAEYDDWKPFSEQLLTLVRDGNRQEAMRWLSALFEGLIAIKMFPGEAFQPLMEMLNEHFVAVQEQMLDFVATAEQTAEVTGEQLSQPPEAPVEAAAAV